MARKAAPVAPKLSLEGDLDIFSIHQQWEQTLPLLTAASGSAELDLSGLQLLGALDRDLRAKGLPLVVVGAKEEWKTRFATLGLAHLLDGAHP